MLKVGGIGSIKLLEWLTNVALMHEYNARWVGKNKPGKFKHALSRFQPALVDEALSFIVFKIF